MQQNGGLCTDQNVNNQPLFRDARDPAWSPKREFMLIVGAGFYGVKVRKARLCEFCSVHPYIEAQVLSHRYKPRLKLGPEVQF